MTDLDALATQYDHADDATRHAILQQLDAEDAERDARLRAPDALANAANWYASVGIRIFPCEPAGKKPLGRLAPHGLKDATCDPDTIRAWWTTAPQANIGIPTGHGFDVIDVDGPEGWASLHDLEKKEPVDSYARAYTGGGGLHLFVPCDGGPNGARLAAGIDVRAAGGYVIAPPSRHPSGNLYTWSVDTPPTALPSRKAAA